MGTIIRLLTYIYVDSYPMMDNPRQTYVA